MKSRIKKLEGLSRQLDITLPPDRVKKVLGEVVSGIRNKVTIPGYRKGKAPEDMVFNRYREDAMDELRRRLIPQAYQDALQEHNVDPVSYPELSEAVMDAEGAMMFTAKVDVQPEVKLKKYKDIKVTGAKVAVSEEEVEETLTRIRNMHAEYEDVDRVIQKGDFGVCDVEAFIDGKPISKKTEKVWIEADKDKSMLGLGEQLCGMKKGQQKTIETKLPENYPDKKYAGKMAEFKVDIKETKEKRLPGLDDELAKKVGKETISQVRDEIRAQLLERKELDAKMKMRNQIIEFLLQKNSFDVPESMVKKQMDVLMKRAEDDLVRKGVDKAAIESNREALAGKVAAEARNKVKLYFILDDIAKQENITVSGEEVDDLLRSMADHYKQDFEDVKKYYEDNDLIGGLKEQISEEKTLDFLLSEAAVTVK